MRATFQIISSRRDLGLGEMTSACPLSSTGFCLGHLARESGSFEIEVRGELWLGLDQHWIGPSGRSDARPAAPERPPRPSCTAPSEPVCAAIPASDRLRQCARRGPTHHLGLRGPQRENMTAQSAARPRAEWRLEPDSRLIGGSASGARRGRTPTEARSAESRGASREGRAE